MKKKKPPDSTDKARIKRLPHDGGLRNLFQHPVMIRDLIRGFISQELAEHLDFDNAVQANHSHVVGESLKPYVGDIAWEIPLLNQDGQPTGENLHVIVLLELQSSVDYWMTLRMLSYICQFYLGLVKNDKMKVGGKLPPVLPIVYSHGLGRWTAPATMAQLVHDMLGLQTCQPQFSTYVLDVSLEDHDKLLAMGDNLVALLMELQQVPEVDSLEDALLRLIPALKGKPSLRLAFESYIRYVLSMQYEPDAQVLDFANSLEEMVMLVEERKLTWKERMRLEGREEGLEQGLEQAAIGLIKQGKLDDESIAAVCNLNMEKIALLRKQLSH